MSDRKNTRKLLVCCISILISICFDLTADALDYTMPISLNSIIVKSNRRNNKLKSNLSVQKKFSSFKVVGDREVMKPIVGESIAQYNLIINNEKKNNSENKVSFYLKEPAEGVSITKNGRLTVLPKVVAKQISIKAVINNKFNIITEVKLSESFILGLKDKEGFSLVVPKTNEIKEVVSSDNILNRADFIMLFRVAIICISSIILILYFIWRRKWKIKNIS